MNTFALIPGASLTALMAAGAASAHTEVELKNIAARVVVTPENRSDVELKVAYGNAKVPIIMVSTRGSTLVADGKLGASQSLEFSEGGCGNWQLGDVAGKAEVNIGGSGDISLTRRADAAINIGGSGNFTAASVNAIEANIGGNGDITVAKVDGPVKVNIGGSGNVKLSSGMASSMEVNIAGSGDVRFAGEARSLEVNIIGSGDVRVKSVTGDIRKSVLGSGNVIVGAF